MKFWIINADGRSGSLHTMLFYFSLFVSRFVGDGKRAEGKLAFAGIVR